MTERDYAILRHVAHYRLTTREALHRALFRQVAINAVTKVTSRLLAEGWLNQYPVFYKSFYFTLTPRAAELLAMPQAAITAPLSTKALAREYGMLGFCCLLKTPRCRLLASEVQEDYPPLYFAESRLRPLLSGCHPSAQGLRHHGHRRRLGRGTGGCRCQVDLRARCAAPAFANSWRRGHSA